MTKKVKCVSCEDRGRRFCPAFDNMICSVCCGSKRGSDIQCASDCQHYPLSTTGYDLWLKIDDTMNLKTIKYVIDYYGKEEFEEAIEQMSFSDGNIQVEFAGNIGSAVEYLLYIKRDAQGKTLFKRWQEQNFEGLNNDEKVMMQYRESTSATIIEIQKVLDHQAIECVDLLEKQQESFILFDRSIASCVSRFTRLFTWATHYPHFSRPNYGCVEIPDTIFSVFMDFIQEKHKKEKKNHPGLTLKRHLSENFGEYCEVSFEMTKLKREAMLNNMDVHHCTATYGISDKIKIEAILEKYPDFEWDDRDPDEGDVPGTLYYVWLRRGESKELEKVMPVSFQHADEDEAVGTIGNIKLHSDKLIIEVFSKKKFVFAKKIVKKYFGKLITLQKEKIVDLAKQISDRTEDEEDEYSHTQPSQTIPPDIERAMVEEFYKKYYKKFLHDPVPMIDGKTPKEASGISELRPQLIELMKLHLKNLDRLNSEKSTNINIDWLLDELGVRELK